MNQTSPSNPRRIFLEIDDEDDSPQRYPLTRLIAAVQLALGHETETWRVFRAWGQGRKTAELTDALEEIDVLDDLEITAQALLDLDDDPDEWFFDVIIFTSDRSMSFGIFDSGYMFVDGPRDQVREIGAAFERVTEYDSATAPPAVRGEV